MIRLFSILILCYTVFVNPVCHAQQTKQQFNHPGGIVMIDITKSSTQLPIVKYGLHDPVIIEKESVFQILIGISLDTVPGDYLVFIDFKDTDSSPFNKKITIMPWSFTMLNNETEHTPSNLIHNNFSNLDYQNTQQPSLPLYYPAQGKWANFFGHIANSEQHTTQQNYISLSTTELITITAPQNAIVSKIVLDNTDLYTVFLDHGRGLYSVLSGLTDLSVEEGNGINRGAVIGKLPTSQSNIIPSKLIWQCVLNGVYVDPEILTLL